MKTIALFALLLLSLVFGCATDPATKLMTTGYTNFVVVAADTDVQDWLADGLRANDVPATAGHRVVTKFKDVGDLEARLLKAGFDVMLWPDRQGGAILLEDLETQRKALAFYRCVNYDIAADFGRSPHTLRIWLNL